MQEDKNSELLDIADQGKVMLYSIAVAADEIKELAKDSVVLLEQVRTIDKRRLREKMGTLDTPDMTKVNHAIEVSFGL